MLFKQHTELAIISSVPSPLPQHQRWPIPKLQDLKINFVYRDFVIMPQYIKGPCGKGNSHDPISGNVKSWPKGEVNSIGKKNLYSHRFELKEIRSDIFKRSAVN